MEHKEQGKMSITKRSRRLTIINGTPTFIEMGEFKKRRAKSKAARKARRKQRKN